MLYGYRIAAVCVTRIYDEKKKNFLESLNNTLTEHGWRCFFYTTDTDMGTETLTDLGEQQIFDLIDYELIDAVIFYSNSVTCRNSRVLLKNKAEAAGKPFIQVDEEDPTCYNVLFDYRGGFRQVVEHVVDFHGVKNIHFIAGFENNPYSDDRKAIVSEVLEKHGVTFTEEMVSYGNFWSGPAEEAVDRLVSKDAVPGAIICANDTMAIAVCSRLYQHGYHVPDDVIVTGFDGIDAIRYYTPRTTSCTCDATLLGEETAHVVMDIVDGNEVPKTTYVMPSLIISESCGCKPIGQTDCIDFVNIQQNTLERYHGEDRVLAHLSSSLQISKDLEHLTKQMLHPNFYDMFCIVKKEVLDPNLNPMRIQSRSTYGKDLYLLADTKRGLEVGNRNMVITDIIPNMEKHLQTPVPLIFIGLNYLNIPLGYCCFNFNDFDRQNYLKIGQIANMLNTAIGGYRNMRYQQHLQMIIEDRYRFDALTGLHNRNSFLRKFADFYSERTSKITIVMADLDNLKYINDSFTHSNGDIAISVVADAIREACKGGLCCRYGGDEIVGLMNTETDPDELRNKINSYISSFNETANKPYQVSASLGIFQTDISNFDTMFHQADMLMYDEKNRKKLGL